MILTEKVLVKKKGNNKLSHYSKLGYDITMDEFFVNVTELTDSSSIVVEVKCDFCGNVKLLSYSKYVKNISKHKKYSCSRICSTEKIKKTNLVKYGHDWAVSSKLIKDKTKKTNLEKYGEEYTFNIKTISDKIKETNLKKYGYENPFQSEIIKEKIKNTNLEKYGSENPASNEKIKERIRETNLEKYGVEYYVQTNNFNLLNKEKIKETNFNKYDGHPTQNDYYRIKFNITNHTNSLFNCDCGKEHEFVLNSDQYRGRIVNNNPLCTICYPISNHKSIKEMELYFYIKEVYNGEIISSYRDGLEIDIYLPELNLGFEFNGLYWHSDDKRDKNYHLNKTNYFKEREVQIVHIWEDDWIYKKCIVKSQILNRIGKTENKIFARKCIIKEVNSKDSRSFLNNNHIQGYVNSVIKLGLFYKGEIVSLMTFDHFEGRKKMEDSGWNLSRFCNLLNTNVIGGASKLLNHFIKTYNPLRIISYADKDWSVGSLYYKLGFENINESKPDYKYIINNQRIHKSNFKKSNLKTDLTESVQMKINGFDRIWDCGKIKFEKK